MPCNSKISPLFLAMVLAASISACGGDDKNTGTSDGGGVTDGSGNNDQRDAGPGTSLDVPRPDTQPAPDVGGSEEDFTDGKVRCPNLNACAAACPDGDSSCIQNCVQSEGPSCGRCIQAYQRCVQDSGCLVNQEVDDKCAFDKCEKYFGTCFGPRPTKSDCKSNKDCTDSKTCAVALAPDGTGLITACQKTNTATGKTGDKCDSNKDPNDPQCPNFGLAAACFPLNDGSGGVCSGICSTDADCGGTLICTTLNIRYSANDPTKTSPVSICQEKVVANCKKNQDCKTGQVCGVRLDNAGKALVTTCVAPVGKLAAGAACNPDLQDPKPEEECDIGLCFNNGKCAQTCGADADCGKDNSCQGINLRIGGTEARPEFGTAPFCVPCAGSCAVCKSNTECQNGEVCKLGATIDGTPSGRCSAPEKDGVAPGEKCGDPKKGEKVCANDLCFRAGTCGALCGKQEDCPKDSRCVFQSISAGKGLTLCVPFTGSAKTCKKDADCTGGEVCTIFPGAESNKFDTVCAAAQPNGVKPGEACGDPATGGKVCANDICLNNGKCSAVCDADADCTAGTKCQPVPLTSGANAPTVKLCVPPANPTP